MAIRRSQSSNVDWMARRQDERLQRLEEDLTSVYNEAKKGVTEKWDKFSERYIEQNATMLSRLAEDEITQEEYDAWVRSHILQDARYEGMVNSITDILTNSDIAAMAMVNGELPYIIAQSYDFTQFVGSLIAGREEINIGTWQIYNARSVQMLIDKNPDILPAVDIPVDQRWNRDHVNNAIAQGLIQGNSMPQIAQRLQNVAQMDDNAAIRNARTAVTCAENMGRNEAYNFMRENGVPAVKEWSATLDDRTRDTHLLLNDTRPNEDGYFGEGILHPAHLMQFPADPNGEPQERYNCRCRLQVVPEEYSREANESNYERWMRENYPEDWENVQAYDNREGGKNEQRERALERIPEARERVTANLNERLREERRRR